MVNQKVLIVPYWVRDSLWRGGHNIKDLLDFNTACKLLSRNEIAILHKLQDSKYAEEIFGAPLGVYAFDLIHHWYDTMHPNNRDAYYALRKYVDNVECADEIHARIFSENLENTVGNSHVLIEVPGFGLAVTVFPNFYSGENKTTNVKALAREVAKLLYRYDTMSKIVLSPFGANYVKKLLQ